MIGIDVGHALDRPPTGVSAYCRHLTRALSSLHKDERFRYFYRSNRYPRSFGERLPANASRGLLEWFALPLNSRDLRLFHGLNQRLPAGLSCPTVATFHDLFVMTGEYSTAEFRERFTRLARETAERADCIIAVSEFTARQVVALLGVDPSNVVAVHHGIEKSPPVSDARAKTLVEQLGISRPFFLNIGAIQTRKNIRRIVEALESLDEDVDLVLAGPSGYGADEIRLAIESSPARPRIHLTGFVDLETRSALYAIAEALVFPSLDEGFGLPVIEAFAAGLPVVTSNVSALPEVAGDAALFVDPNDTEEIGAAMRRVIEDSARRNSLVAKGTARAKLFTWQRAARETWAVYERFS